MRFRRVVLKTLVVTRKKAPRFAQKVAKSVALSSTAEVFLHHKPPDGTLVMDVTVIESLEACIKIIAHHL
jgi:hypothetical protein